MGSLDEEPLAVRASRGVLAPPERRGDDRQRREREQPADHLPENPIACAPPSIRRNTTWRRSSTSSESCAVTGCHPSPCSSALRSPASSSSASRAAATCPPAKPISTLRVSDAILGLLRRLHDLGQDAAGRLRVHESDPAAADANARLLVDQLEPRAPQPLQRRFDVLDRVGHVMQPLPAALDELADDRVGAERLQQFDVAVAHVEQRGLDALRLDPLAVRHRHPECSLVERCGSVEVRDRDADVIDPIEHGRGSLRLSRPRPGSSRVIQACAAPSARRISARAAVPTSSCSWVGGGVAPRRWISVPGRRSAWASEVSGLRSLHANSSAAIPTPTIPAAPRAIGPGCSRIRSITSWPAIESASNGTTRCEPQRSCSLGTSLGSIRPCSYAPIALCSPPWYATRSESRSATSAGSAPRIAATLSRHSVAGRPRRSAPLSSVTVAAAASTRGSSSGSRAAGRFRRASGTTAKPSSSLIGPRSSGTVATAPPMVGLRPDATSSSPSGLRAAIAHEVGPWISRPL